MRWRPIEQSDQPLREPPLHTAILSRDNGAIETLLAEYCNINESDSEGNTPLHLCIQTGNEALFLRLLRQGADTGLCNGWDHSLLHQAAKYDTEGKFLPMLIDASDDINPLVRDLYTPLDVAVKANNHTAIEILSRRGAERSKYN
jgi:ankyrin repeat protein